MLITDINRFKALTSSDVFKGMTTTYSSKLEAYAFIGSQPLTWYYVDKTPAVDHGTSDMEHLFYSFGISRADTNTNIAGSDLVDMFNASRMVIATIPQSGCGSYIDGSTLELRVPILTSSTTSYITLYGASYNGYTDDNGYLVSRQYDTDLFGCATVFLFANAPYTGMMGGEVHPNSGCPYWTTANVGGAAMYPHLAATHWSRSSSSTGGTTGNTALGYGGGWGTWDVPAGIAFLEKGIFVMFDSPNLLTTLVAAVSGATVHSVWNSLAATFASKTTLNAAPATNNRNGLVFTGTNANATARLIYRTVTQDYKMVYFCHAGQNEFNSTTNYTYDNRKAFYRPEEADSLYVTEIGLYDSSDLLIAYAKLSQPIEKSSLETITFKVELQV